MAGFHLLATWGNAAGRFLYYRRVLSLPSPASILVLNVTRAIYNAIFHLVSECLFS